MSNTGGSNPPFLVDDFLAFYPQFKIVEVPVIEMFIEVADATISQSKWNKLWKMGMCLHTAHNLTLHLGTIPATDSTTALLSAGMTKGLTTSKSAGDVSKTVDYSAAIREGGGAWNLTLFGQQLLTYSRLVGVGGMVVR